MRVVIPGGTGFLGRAVAPALIEMGDSVTVLSRRPASDSAIRHVQWDAETLGDWVETLEGADAIVHLTGKRVDCRPTRSNIAELIRSRVDPVLLVGRALREVASPPQVWVQSATLAVFGDGGDEILDESTVPSGRGPKQMVQVALAWENAYHQATAEVARSVLLRIGVAIGGDEDPATQRLQQLARLGLAGPVGGGHQWMSWISLDDLVEVMVRAVHDPTMAGTYHVTAPNPITNRDMMAVARSEAGRSFGLPSPAWLTRLGAPLLGSDPELALTGRRVIPTRLLSEGFEFQQTEFSEAFALAADIHEV